MTWFLPVVIIVDGLLGILTLAFLPLPLNWKHIIIYLGLVIPVNMAITYWFSRRGW